MNYKRLSLLLLLTAAFAVNVEAGKSSSIIFMDQPRSRQRFGSSSTAAEAEITVNSKDNGQQTSNVDVLGKSTQEQGSGGNSQESVNNVEVHVGQGQENGDGGSGGSQDATVNVNVESNQVQNNVNGTLIHIDRGHKGVVNVITLGEEGQVVDESTVNNKPVADRTIESSNCKYICKRHEAFYCCDDGTNPHTERKPDIHGGNCPMVRSLCIRNTLIIKCAHDGQCAPSDRCCFDACVDRHICKQAVAH